MKKFLLALLCVTMIACFAGCGETAMTTSPTTNPEASTTTVEGEPRDGESLIDEIVAKIKDVFD